MDADPKPTRRAWLATLAGAVSPLGASLAAPDTHAGPIQRGRALAFPADHGAHAAARLEWWYLTGWLQADSTTPDASGLMGFQITFFRARTGLAETLPGRLAPRQLLFAHAAVTDTAGGRHRHAERLARWNGQWQQAPEAFSQAAVDRRDVRLGRWRLDARQAVAQGPGLSLELQFDETQPLLLQGEAGWSRKGPEPTQASHYYSLPQLAVRGTLGLDGKTVRGSGRGWLDHEWSDEILHADAVGWDWIGMNLADGTALTAFRLRRADGSALWAGGSVRVPGAPVRAFGPQEVVFEPGRRWHSAATQALYPVEWTVRTPAGVHRVRTLLDAQEMDGRGSTGTVYWEGLSELLDLQGNRVGLGYLEMTGYAGRLRL
ncbi:MAG: hypothetical protein RI988_248 [Pseudomonadota bacterium]|jgi:predicted secreted hydrolase